MDSAPIGVAEQPQQVSDACDRTWVGWVSYSCYDVTRLQSNLQISAPNRYRSSWCYAIKIDDAITNQYSPLPPTILVPPTKRNLFHCTLHHPRKNRSQLLEGIFGTTQKFRKMAAKVTAENVTSKSARA